MNGRLEMIQSESSHIITEGDKEKEKLVKEN